MINITESEWKVMEVLWDTSPLTLREILLQLKGKTPWSTTTVRTLLVRLMDKGAVKADKSIANFKYSPLIEKEVCQKQEARNFLDKVFNGSMGMLVSTLVKESQLSDEEREELLKIISKMDGQEEE